MVLFLKRIRCLKTFLSEHVRKHMEDNDFPQRYPYKCSVELQPKKHSSDGTVFGKCAVCANVRESSFMDSTLDKGIAIAKGKNSNKGNSKE